MKPTHALFSSVLVALLAAGCATDRQVIAQASDTHKELEPSILKDAELAQYLQAMGDRITSAAKALDAEHFGPKSHFKEDAQWMFSGEEFHFVASDQLNAFTTGGEHMYVYTELLRTCRSEDELAAVMAHEYGHVYARHVQKGMNRQYLALGATAAGGVLGYTLAKHDKAQWAALGAVSAGTAGTFLNLGYTRDDEAEADALGFEFYSRAGWDPAHFGDFFQQLIDKGYDKGSEMTSDHPKLSSRVEAAKKHARDLPADAQSWRKPPVANEARFHALQARATQLAKAIESSGAAKGAQTLLAAVPSCLLPEDTAEQKNAQSYLKAVASGK